MMHIDLCDADVPSKEMTKRILTAYKKCGSRFAPSCHDGVLELENGNFIVQNGNNILAKLIYNEDKDRLKFTYRWFHRNEVRNLK